MRLLVVAAFVVLAPLLAAPAAASTCGRSSTGMVPLADFAAGTYKGDRGGLYGDGRNEPPAIYRAAGLRAAATITPRGATGAPDPNGKIVLLSIGMSNTTQEFSAFVPLARQDDRRDAHVVVVDGAIGGQDATRWTSPSAETWGTVDTRLRSAGVSAAQVQAIWLKQAIAQPRGDFPTESKRLADALRAIVDVSAQRFPNLQQVFLSPRTYAGYASTTLNPEPYAYESAFPVRAVVLDSVAKPDARPWLGWGPYLWTDGAKGRSDGLVWTCDDVVQDGTHPSDSGRRKVATMLKQFFDSSEFAGWYRGEAPASTTVPPATVTSPEPSGQQPQLVLIGAGAFALFVASVLMLRRLR